MTDQKCLKCQKIFKDYKSNHRTYCSRDCMYLSLEKNYKHSCLYCGRSFVNKIKGSKFCSLRCSSKVANKGKTPWNKGKEHRAVQGENHPMWKRGWNLSAYGYIEKNIGRGRRVFEHRYIMEMHIGRKLNSNEHIHHINGEKTDNRIENLLIVSPSDHGRLHIQQRRLSHV